MRRLALIIATLAAAAACTKNGGEGTLSVSPAELTATYKLGSVNFNINSTEDWSINTLNEEGLAVNWAKPGKLQGSGNASVNVRVYLNEYSNPRTVNITVSTTSGQKAIVKLTQEGNPDSSTQNDERTFRVGTYNIRVITNETDPENNWENRKYRLLQSIKENAWDIFGINECSTDQQTYLAEQLKDMYNCQYFSPYSQSGTGKNAQGIIYKKTFTLSDWHYFWLAENPDIMTTNDVSDHGSYNRGGCCAILTHNDSGIKLFYMVAHGALRRGVREQYAYLFAQMEKKYNPNGYPSFFVGDMNAGQDETTSVTFREYWNDTFLKLGTSDRTGPAATHNGFDLSVNMYTRDGRIDYIYYRNATPLKYVCNDTKYGGYYASDHLPVYADMKVNRTAK